MLDNAQACLEVLKREPEQVVPTVPAVSAANYARTLRIGPPPQAIIAEAHRSGQHRARAHAAGADGGAASHTRLGQRSGIAEPVRRGGARGAGEDSPAITRSGTRIRSTPKRCSPCAARSTRSRAAAAWSARASSASSRGRSRIWSTGCSTARWRARPRCSTRCAKPWRCCRSWSLNSARAPRRAPSPRNWSRAPTRSPPDMTPPRLAVAAPPPEARAETAPAGSGAGCRSGAAGARAERRRQPPTGRPPN